MNRPARTTLADATVPEAAVPEAPASGSVLPTGSSERSASPAPSAPSTPAAPAAEIRSEPSPELLAHLQSRPVFQRLRGFVLHKNVPARHAEDVVQQSLVEAWNARHTWGPTTTDLDKLLYAITDCNVADHKKSWFRSRLASAAGPTPERDPKCDAENEYTGRAQDYDAGDVPPVNVSSSLPWATPADPYEARFQLRDVSDFVQKTPGFRRAAGWMLRNLAGESFREIAEGEGTSENAVYTCVSKLRAALRKAAHDGLLMLLVALFLGILFKHLRHRPKDDVGMPTPRPTPTAVAPRPEPAPQPQPQAAELRARASEECGAKQWEDCLNDLIAASQLDPHGDAAPRVKELRKAAEYGIAHMNDKPPSP